MSCDGMCCNFTDALRRLLLCVAAEDFKSYSALRATAVHGIESGSLTLNRLGRTERMGPFQRVRSLPCVHACVRGLAPVCACMRMFVRACVRAGEPEERPV